MNKIQSKILHDADIREPLFFFLEETYGKIRIFEEKNTGNSRADVVMVTKNAICGIEIKSDADSYARLATQIRDYDCYYDYNYVVAGARHAMHIEKHVPDYWGIIIAEEMENEPLDFYILRKPLRNPKMVFRLKLMQLWRPELAAIQQMHDMPKYKDKSKNFVIGKILERMEYPADKKGHILKQELENEISDLLFERDYTNVDDAFKKKRYKKKRRSTVKN